jgi:tRNA(Ile)-lysidine synthase
LRNFFVSDTIKKVDRLNAKRYLNMLEKVRLFLKKHDLLVPNSTVVIGVSGGPDSLALLDIFLKLQNEFQLHIIAAHIDHMFRGKQSEEDMEFVKRFCAERRIICEVKQMNVPEFQKRSQLSAQVAARQCRYRFFAEVMKKHSARYLALGHHGDDQVETILMRLVRGSIGRGYGGIPVKREFGPGYIIRPLLSVSRDEIEAYCKEQQLQPRYDPSNEKDTYTRNRFRHYVVPLLKKENPNVHERFQHFSEMVAEDEAFLEELTLQALDKVIKRQQRKVIMQIQSFKAMPKPLQRRGIQLILNYLYEDIPSDLSSIHISSFLTFLERKDPSGSLDFPNGLKIIRSYDCCTFTFQEERMDQYHFKLEIPSVLSLPNGHAIISEVWEHYPKELTGNDVFIIDSESVSLPLHVRTRRAGDRMTLKGTNGTKKIKDIFIDAKIPLAERETWPIVEDGTGNILWLPCLKKSIYEATDITKKRYIVLHYKEQ